MTRLRFVLASAAALLVGGPATADVTVAVAANFTEPAKAIAAAFERAGGAHVVLSFGASGGFATQISHGAPFDLFLSADAERPAQLETGGLVAPGSRFTYAVGQLALWSKTAGLVANGAALRSASISKVAIADPATAPYGKAAVETMQRLKLHDSLRPKIVQGSSITQAYQFAQTGAAEIGFVALSQVIDQPAATRWIVPERLHAPIVQQAVLLKASADKTEAKAFWRYLHGGTAQTIIKRFGYRTH